MGTECINRVMLVGNVGRAPEVQHVDFGKKRATFQLATQNGDKEAVQWHRIVVSNAFLAELVAKSVVPGSRVLIEGELKYRSYKDRAGTVKIVSEVEVGQFKATLMLLDPKGARVAEVTE